MIKIAQLLVLSLSVFIVAQPVRGSEITKAWRLIYSDVTGDPSPPWRSLDEAIEWVVGKQAEVEPVVLRILKGEIAALPWTSALPVARYVATDEVRDQLVERIADLRLGSGDSGNKRSINDSLGLSGAIDILSRNRDPRVLSIASSLLLEGNEDLLTLRSSVDALRRMGESDSLATLRKACDAQMPADLSMRCKVAEEVLSARSAGKDIFEDAEAQLQSVSRTFAEAIRQKDFTAYRETVMSEIAERMDEATTSREVFEEGQVQQAASDILAALQAGNTFTLEEDDLLAELRISQTHKLTFVYEAEGWKVGSIIMERSHGK